MGKEAALHKRVASDAQWVVKKEKDDAERNLNRRYGMGHNKHGKYGHVSSRVF